MVRHKCRWLLVKLYVNDNTELFYNQGEKSKATHDNGGKQQEQKNKEALSPSSMILNQIDTSDIYRSLRDTVECAFGISGLKMLIDTQVRYYDSESKIILIKTSRKHANYIRAAITLLTNIVPKSARTSMNNNSTNKKYDLSSLSISTSVISINGCARTAKMSLLHELRRQFNDKYNVNSGSCNIGKKQLLKLEEQMEKVRNLDN